MTKGTVANYGAFQRCRGPAAYLGGTRWFDDVSSPSQRHGDALPHASEYCDR